MLQQEIDNFIQSFKERDKPILDAIKAFEDAFVELGNHGINIKVLSEGNNVRVNLFITGDKKSMSYRKLREYNILLNNGKADFNIYDAFNIPNDLKEEK